MAKEITKEDAIMHKKKAIRTLGNVFEAFINSPEKRHLKKADLLSYWIESYSKYILDEEAFDYSKVPRYKRGDVISVNFGFNVGSEHGGRHYAIVLDNDNKQSSKVITVIPLSSGTPERTYERDVFLGNELYDKLKTKYDKSIVEVQKELDETKQMLEVLKKTISVDNFESSQNDGGELAELIKKLENRVDSIYEREKIIKGYENEIAKLKSGSRAMMEQITTISKMRIYKPRTSHDLLYGVKFSDGAMNKINDKIKELYVFQKRVDG